MRMVNGKGKLFDLLLIIANRFCSVFKDLASLTTKELMDVVK